MAKDVVRFMIGNRTKIAAWNIVKDHNTEFNVPVNGLFGLFYFNDSGQGYCNSWLSSFMFLHMVR